MAHLKINLENDNLLYYSRLLAQLAMIEDIAGGGDNPNSLAAHQHTGVSESVARACEDAHLHLTDGEPPLPEVKPHVPFNPFAGQTTPLAPPAPHAPLPAAAGAPLTAPVAPMVTSIAPPPPPGVQSAPNATTTAPEPAAVTQAHAESDEDSEGVTWDARIHSSERGKKIDGTWKLRRGVDKDLAASVLAELRAKSKFPGTVVAPPSAPPPPPAPPAPPAPPRPAGILHEGTTPSVPSPPQQVASVLTPPVPTPASEGPMTFKDFMKWTLEQVSTGKIRTEQINKALSDANIPAITTLNTPTGVGYLADAKLAIETFITFNQ